VFILLLYFLPSPRDVSFYGFVKREESDVVRSTSAYIPAFFAPDSNEAWASFPISGAVVWFGILAHIAACVQFRTILFSSLRLRFCELYYR